jgi:hypothetical protein
MPMMSFARRAMVLREIDRLSFEFFQAVSFGAGSAPDYRHLQTLFIPSGLLIRNSGSAPVISTVSELITKRQPGIVTTELTQFCEREQWHRTELFGQIAQRFAAYAKTGRQKGVAFVGRGMMCTQFIETPMGWKITAMAWDDERPGLTVEPHEAVLAAA